MATLRLACRVIPGFAFKSSDLADSGIPVVKIGSITDTGAVDLDAGQFLPETLVEERHEKFFLSNGDIVLAMTGEGKIGRIRSEQRSLLNQRVCKLEAFEAEDQQYLWVAVRTIDYARVFAQLAQGAAQANISGGQLESLQIPWPQKRLRGRIAETISAYDDLIENNRRRMALLEESARQLYREWFVRLRFPGHEHTRFTNGVAAGWRKVSLGEITSKLGSGFTPRGGESAYLSTGTPLIRSLNVYDDLFEAEGLAFVSEEHAAALAGVTVESKDILLNITGASVARCCMAPERYLPARVNQHVMIIRIDPEKADPFFVHKAINSDERKRQLLSYAQKGATREALTKEMMASFEITLPTDTLIQQFADFARPSFQQREILAYQNQKLHAARDLLLPRLMSGEIAL